MKSKLFPQYPQELEDDISVLSDYLFEKFNDAFDIFYLEECNGNSFDTSNKNCTRIGEDGNEVI